MPDILPQSPPSSNQQFDPFTASDESLIVWMDERKQLREEEDRAAYEAWIDDCEGRWLREQEELERNPWGDE